MYLGPDALLVVACGGGEAEGAHQLHLLFNHKTRHRGQTGLEVLMAGLSRVYMY